MASTLKEIIRQGEGPQVEFKKTLPQLEKIAKTLVAFANSHGGILLVGIQDDKYVCGVAFVEEELYLLEKANSEYCDPKVTYRMEEEEIYGKQVLVIRIDESRQKPHKAQSAQGELQVYIRAGDQCVAASNLVVKILENQRLAHESVRPKPLTNNEMALFGFLDRQNKITLKEYAKLINVSKRRAFRILIDLTLSGQLFMHDFEQTLFFTKA